MNTTGGISDVYYTEITPAGWTFSVWGLIYAWQAAWLIYGVSTIFRRTSYGYLYIAPGHMHPSLYLVFAFNLLTNIGWLLLWDRQLPQYALIMIIMTALSLYVCLGISFLRLHARGSVLKREGYGYEVWLVRILVQNGLGLYAAWVTIASLINVDVVMQYTSGIAQHIASTVCLCFLLLAIVSWFFFDNFLADAYTRYTVTPYPLLVFALTGSLVKNWDMTKSNSVLTAVLLATACVATILKVAIMLLRHARRPTFVDNFFISQSVYGSTSDRDRLLFNDKE